MEKYIHKVKYYETDKMGITHHSNYIRWMEEARIDFLENIGFGFKQLEKDGIISPVTEVECKYKTPTTFDDDVEISVDVGSFSGVRLTLKYEMTNKKTGDLVALCTSDHCFVNKDGKVIILKKSFPEFDKKLRELATKNK